MVFFKCFFLEFFFSFKNIFVCTVLIVKLAFCGVNQKHHYCTLSIDTLCCDAPWPVPSNPAILHTVVKLKFCTLR